jgi:hypothetical protein
MDVVDAKRSNSTSLLWVENMRPLTSYTPFRNLNVGNFVLMGLHNPNFVSL